MIKYLGSIGSFIKLNDTEDKTYTLLEVFSSSAAQLSLFSAEVNNSTGAITYSSASTQTYVNGVSSSVLYPGQWSHLIFSFNDNLATFDTNNFLIRFGSASSNFNMQNMYILENSFSPSDASYMHKEFTGAGDVAVRINDSASYSINLIDYPEDTFISYTSSVVYQPLNKQVQYKTDVIAATESSLVQFESTDMVNDNLYIDGIRLAEGNRVLSLADDAIYEVNNLSRLSSVVTSNGDLVKVLSGQYFSNMFFVKTETGFELTTAHTKIASFVNRN